MAWLFILGLLFIIGPLALALTTDSTFMVSVMTVTSLAASCLFGYYLFMILAFGGALTGTPPLVQFWHFLASFLIGPLLFGTARIIALRSAVAGNAVLQNSFQVLSWLALLFCIARILIWLLPFL